MGRGQKWQGVSSAALFLNAPVSTEPSSLSAVETRRDYVRFSPGFLQSSELVIRIFSALPAFECAFLGARSLIWSKLCSDVLSKIREDFDAAGVVQSDEQILRVMNEFTLEAGNQGPVTRGGAPDALAVMLARQGGLRCLVQTLKIFGDTPSPPRHFSARLAFLCFAPDSGHSTDTKIGSDLHKRTLGRNRRVFGSLTMAKTTKLSRRPSSSKGCAAPINRKTR